MHRSEPGSCSVQCNVRDRGLGEMNYILLGVIFRSTLKHAERKAHVSAAKNRMSTTETRRKTPSRRGARAVSDTGSNLNTLTALATLARLSCALGPTAMCLSAMVPAKGRRWSNIPSISERQHHNRSTTLISRPLWNVFGSGIGIPDTGVDNTTSGYGAKVGV